MSPYSTELLARAQTVIPGGVNSPVRAFRAVEGNPVFFKRGRGPYLYDVDENTYIDYVGSWGPLILGHAHPDVLNAVFEVSKQGLSFGAPTVLEVEMAELLTTLLPPLEQVRLVCSGTEATQSALRLARGFTNRTKIIKFIGCYHGHVDSLLTKAGSGVLTFDLPDSAGIPEGFSKETISIPFNDIEAIETVFKLQGDKIAAVIVEPVAGNMNCVLPDPDFLPTLRTLCDEYQTLLIFDEVITGFRVALRGASDRFSITPDLICLGKILGGGLPMAAFGGRRDVMSALAPIGPVYQAGTLAGNPVAVAAGLATLKTLIKDHPYERLEMRTVNFLQSIEDLAKHYGIPLKTQHCGSMWGLFFTEERHIHNFEQVKKSNKKHFNYFFHQMLKKGHYFAPSSFESGFLSIMHDESILGETLTAAEEVFKTWKTAF